MSYTITKEDLITLLMNVKNPEIWDDLDTSTAHSELRQTIPLHSSPSIISIMLRSLNNMSFDQLEKLYHKYKK